MAEIYPTKIYLTIGEVYQMQHLLIDRFGGRHGVRDKNAIEAAVFRPQNGYYNSLEEEAAALMESLGNNHGFIDGNKRIAFTAADVFLRRNGFYIEVEALGIPVHLRLAGSARIPFSENPGLDPAAHPPDSIEVIGVIISQIEDAVSRICGGVRRV